MQLTLQLKRGRRKSMLAVRIQFVWSGYGYPKSRRLKIGGVDTIISPKSALIDKIDQISIAHLSRKPRPYS